MFQGKDRRKKIWAGQHTFQLRVLFLANGIDGGGVAVAKRVIALKELCFECSHNRKKRMGVWGGRQGGMRMREKERGETNAKREREREGELNKTEREGRVRSEKRDDPTSE